MRYELSNEIRHQQFEISAIKEEKQLIDEKLMDAREQQKNLVQEALYDVQDSLDSGETVTLMQSEEVSRGGHYTFEEVLTPEGMMVENVTGMGSTYRGESRTSEVLYGWNGGHWADQEEPLDIAEEYLTCDRSEPEFIDKLAERLQHIEAGAINTPTHSFYYD